MCRRNQDRLPSRRRVTGVRQEAKPSRTSSYCARGGRMIILSTCLYLFPLHAITRRTRRTNEPTRLRWKKETKRREESPEALGPPAPFRRRRSASRRWVMAVSRSRRREAQRLCKRIAAFDEPFSLDDTRRRVTRGATPLATHRGAFDGIGSSCREAKHRTPCGQRDASLLDPRQTARETRVRKRSAPPSLPRSAPRGARARQQLTRSSRTSSSWA